MLAASALAANMFMRSLLAGAFPLFATASKYSLQVYMAVRNSKILTDLSVFHNLGIDWAFSLLGFVAVAMIPIPIL